ncbi:ubiquinone biosynthesis O-methyltransferase, mitochondrial-like isoform X2 [Photinus pyralis]|uniref:ubiquinone biosynthesis O-methyltransferase, mitochondrial-like isoform X2 n=1 Tax=Photinus pyralis TaxID=7054 RepID=UPI0012673181|nr:ubiquinone biosynthesis O-methyltransferase, mitochondrial-like isoform X2 [Photinus pyralis]
MGKKLIHERSTVDNGEIEHFKTLNQRWWSGKSKLQSFNDVRVPYIFNALLLTENIKSVENLKILDVGCGGLLSEELAKLGAIVDAIDPGSDSVEVARHHASLNPTLVNLTYIVTTIEEHAIENAEKYDVVIASEVVEHVTEKEMFLEACIKCLKPNGSLFITTFNKTIRSWIMGIVLIQEVLNIIPRGTHAWNKFISPDAIRKILEIHNCKTVDVQGIRFNFLSRSWSQSSSTSINYALHAKKIL